MFLSTSSNLVAVTAVLALVSSLVSSDLGAGSFPNFATTQYPKADRAHGEVWREAKLQLESIYFRHMGRRRGWVSSCRAAGGETRHLRTDRWKEG